MSGDPVAAAVRRRPLRALLVEDSSFDAMMMVNTLRRHGFDVTHERVEALDTLERALLEQPWEMVLSDYNLPGFTAVEALKVLQATGLDIPFIIVSGGIGEPTAVEVMKSGAADYVMKGSLERLAPAVDRELRDAADRRARREVQRALGESELRNRLLWETCPDAVLMLDPAGNIDFANPAVETLFGRRPEVVVGQHFAILLPERLRNTALAGLRSLFPDEPGKPRRQPREVTALRSDGREILVETVLSEFELQGATRSVLFLRDITQRRKQEEQLRRNQEEFRVVREVQQFLFPKSAPALPGYEIAGATFAAEAAAGDYYDFLPMLNGATGLVVGDVTGHGIGPALLMAETRAHLRTLASNRESIAEIFTRANGLLAEDVGGERFVTLLLARLNPVTRTLVYGNAGHPPGLVLDSNGEVKHQLKRTGPPLGLLPATRYSGEPEVQLAAGDIVLLLTDGIEEATAADDSTFGMMRTLEVVRANRARPAREIIDALHREVCAFEGTETPTDDMTAIVMKVS